MKRKVVWAESARDDLLNIVSHIAVDNPTAAASVAAKLRRVATGLGELATGRAGRVSGTFEKVMPGLPYILAYEIVSYAQGEVVAILHVIHGARDWRPEKWPED